MSENGREIDAPILPTEIGLECILACFVILFKHFIR